MFNIELKLDENNNEVFYPQIVKDSNQVILIKKHDRQVGLTTTLLQKMLLLLVNDKQNIIYICNTKINIQLVIDQIQEFIPDKLKRLFTFTKTQIRYSDNIVRFISNPKQLIGFTNGVIIIDDVMSDDLRELLDPDLNKCQVIIGLDSIIYNNTNYRFNDFGQGYNTSMYEILKKGQYVQIYS